MSKVATIDALLESAIQHFARDGLEGTSLRDIANDVGVPLSSIDRYFGSKAELFRAVLQKVWSEVERDRDAVIQQALATNGGEKPDLGDLIYALARPIVQRALSKSKSDVARSALLRMIRNGHPDERRSQSVDLIESFNVVRSLGRWIDAMVLRCPDLSRQDVVWAFSYVSGLIFSRQLIHHQYDMLFDPEWEPTVEGVTGDIVAFGCAGVEAIVQRRKASAKVAVQGVDRPAPNRAAADY
jgi:AcrR family transcriptional regulator